jgi:DNA-binding CsgD family transcriptional regulator
VLRARGIESEAEVPFAGLAELLRPALGALDQIPAPQATALGGALALGPATAGDRFAIGAATLSLLSACAEEGPLALLVDDAHRLDDSSAQALLFAARRLLADRIALVLAVREGEPSLLDGADLRTLRIGGLDRAAAAELLGADVPLDAVGHLYRATGGNPLALLELAPEGARLAALPSAGPIPISTSIAAAFVRRFERLPEPTRRALVLAATIDGGDLGVLARAATALGLDLAALAAAEEAGLVTLTSGEVAFRHPLARSAVYAEAPAGERRAVHAALAAALPDRDADRRAWHLAAASIGPDAQASAALEQAGERARERSAYSVAAGAFERAAGLAPADDARGRLLFAAAEAAWTAGHLERTVKLLGQARLHVVSAVLEARIDHLAGLVAMRRGPVMDGYPLIVAAAETIAEHDPEQAVAMLAEAVHGCFYAGDTPAMVAAAARAVALAGAAGTRRARFFASMAQGIALVADGQGDAGAAAVRSAVAMLEEESDGLRYEPRLVAWSALGPMWLREAGVGRGLVDRAFEQARREGAVGTLPVLLHQLARDQATTDRWAAAEASYDEAIRLCRETGQRSELAAALAGLAWLEARQGREDACRSHAAQAATLCAQLGMGLYEIWTIQALGDLELGLGRPAASVEHHEAQAAALRSRGIADVDLSPGPELVDAYLRLGRGEEAAAAATEFVAAAEAKGQPWALARAARCRGLLAEAGDLEAEFEEALRLHARTPDGFETARTRLAYGARLRRARMRVRAREQLRSAVELFERLGAQPWADQARVELAATGETARRRDVSTLDDLTPQELQIAQLLAAGKTTREAAAAVFLSPKTVEYHLRNVYRKLGIRSREELAASFGERA